MLLGYIPILQRVYRAYFSESFFAAFSSLLVLLAHVKKLTHFCKIFHVTCLVKRALAILWFATVLAALCRDLPLRFSYAASYSKHIL